MPILTALRRALALLAPLVVLGLLVAYPILHGYRPLELLEMLRWEVLAGAVAAYLAYMVARTWRLAYLLARSGDPIPFLPLFRVQARAGALGAVTPARAGEVVKVGLLRRDHGISLSEGTVAFAVEKTQDLASYGVAGLVLLLLLGARAPLPPAALPVSAALVALAAGALVLFALRRSRGLGGAGALLGLSVLVFAGIFSVFYVCLAAHGVPAPGPAFILFTVTSLTGILSMLPGGQGAAQHAFDATARHLLSLDGDIVASLVVHITAAYYAGVVVTLALAEIAVRLRGRQSQRYGSLEGS